MATQLKAGYLLASNVMFQGIVRAAVCKTAIDVFAEDPPDEQRQSLARTILMDANNPASRWVNTFVWIAAANDTIRTAGVTGSTVNVDAITDLSVLTVIENAWNAVSGA